MAMWKRNSNAEREETNRIMLILDWSYVFDRDQLISLYLWLDSIPFRRRRRQIEKDFADGGILRCLIEWLFFLSHLVRWRYGNVSFVLLLSDLLTHFVCSLRFVVCVCPICLFFVEEKCLGILNWMIKFYKISMHGLIKYHWVDLKNELKKIFAMVVRLLLLSLIIDVWFSSISHLIGIYFFSVMVAELIKYYFPTWVRRFSPRVIPLDFEHVDLGLFA